MIVGITLGSIVDKRGNLQVSWESREKLEEIWVEIWLSFSLTKEQVVD